MRHNSYPNAHKHKKSIMLLQSVHRHPRDAFIQFHEEGHVYTIHGETGKYISTTSLVHEQFPCFDGSKIADSIVRKGRTQDPKDKYYGLNKEQILKMWDNNSREASSQGTKIHYDIECFSNGMTVSNDSIEFKQFLQFRQDYAHLKPYRTEWTVFYEEYKICGSIDMVYYNEKTQSYEIYDWKRSREIVYDDSYGKTASTSGLEHLPDTNYWHYSLQLNIYKRILEDKYGIRITGMYLICLHPEHDTYERIEIRVLSREMDIVFESRLNKII